MPGTSPQISDEWKMKYDNERIYLLAKMKDPTNKLGRVIQSYFENLNHTQFNAFRTDEFEENYKEIGEFVIEDANWNIYHQIIQ